MRKSLVALTVLAAVLMFAVWLGVHPPKNDDCCPPEFAVPVSERPEFAAAIDDITADVIAGRLTVKEGIRRIGLAVPPMTLFNTGFDDPTEAAAYILDSRLALERHLGNLSQRQYELLTKRLVE